MENEPTEPYIYQPFGMQDRAHWDAKAIYGIGGIGLATIHGISRELAEKILKLLKDEHIFCRLANASGSAVGDSLQWEGKGLYDRSDR